MGGWQRGLIMGFGGRCDGNLCGFSHLAKYSFLVVERLISNTNQSIKNS